MIVVLILIFFGVARIVTLDVGFPLGIFIVVVLVFWSSWARGVG